MISQDDTANPNRPECVWDLRDIDFLDDDQRSLLVRGYRFYTHLGVALCVLVRAGSHPAHWLTQSGMSTLIRTIFAEPSPSEPPAMDLGDVLSPNTFA